MSLNQFNMTNTKVNHRKLVSYKWQRLATTKEHTVWYKNTSTHYYTYSGWPLSRKCKIPWQLPSLFAALWPMPHLPTPIPNHVFTFYTHHTHISLSADAATNLISLYVLSISTTNFCQLKTKVLPDKIFSLVFPSQFPDKRPIPWQVQNSLTFPGFTEKW